MISSSLLSSEDCKTVCIGWVVRLISDFFNSKIEPLSLVDTVPLKLKRHEDDVRLLLLRLYVAYIK